MHEADLVKPVQKFVSELEKAGGKPLYELTPQEARQVLREVQKDGGVKPEAEIEEIKVPLDNGREMRVLIVRPADVDDTLPVVFYIHGGSGGVSGLYAFAGGSISANDQRFVCRFAICGGIRCQV